MSKDRIELSSFDSKKDKKQQSASGKMYKIELVRDVSSVKNIVITGDRK